MCGLFLVYVLLGAVVQRVYGREFRTGGKSKESTILYVVAHANDNKGPTMIWNPAKLFHARTHTHRSDDNDRLPLSWVD
jgi:hypothetical protein